MAGINFDIETGQIDKGDTKTFTLFVEDDQGNKLALDSIDMTIDVSGAETTYAKSDFSVSGNEYTLKHEFTNSGQLDIDVKATDDPNLDTERETRTDYVNP